MPTIGFSATSPQHSISRVINLTPPEWMQCANKVKPTPHNALLALQATVSQHGIPDDEIGVVHPPPLSEGPDFSIILPGQFLIGVQCKCCEVLTPSMIRDDVIKSSKIVPEGAHMILLIVTAGCVIGNGSPQLLVLSSGECHRLQRTRFHVPSNMEVVVVSTNQLSQRHAFSAADASAIDFLLRVKRGQVQNNRLNVQSLFSILKMPEILKN